MVLLNHLSGSLLGNCLTQDTVELHWSQFSLEPFELPLKISKYWIRDHY